MEVLVEMDEVDDGEDPLVIEQLFSPLDFLLFK